MAFLDFDTDALAEVQQTNTRGVYQQEFMK